MEKGDVLAHILDIIRVLGISVSITLELNFLAVPMTDTANSGTLKQVIYMFINLPKYLL